MKLKNILEQDDEDFEKMRLNTLNSLKGKPRVEEKKTE